MGRAFAVKAVHKNMFPGINFKDEANGTSGTDIAFIDQVTTAANTTIVASIGSHKKVLKQTNIGGWDRFSNIFTIRNAGIREFWMRSTDATDQTFISLSEGAWNTYRIRFYLTTDKLRYYTRAATLIDVPGAPIPIDNTWYHIKIQWYADSTWDLWIDGVQYLDGVDTYLAFTVGIDYFTVLTYDTTTYFDAFGEGEDTDYKIGDNVHWRHYKESTDNFEGDDVGTQGTSITWVDGVDTAASTEIVQEFNEHKKVLRGYYSSAVGGSDNSYHSFASQAKTGWFETWFKVSDATIQNRLDLVEDATIIIEFQVIGDKFRVYTGGAWRDVAGAPVPTDGTWYHVYIQWYDAATDTFDLWIDNVQYEDGTNCVNNQTSGINRCNLYYYSATEYLYLDAPTSSLDSDEKADNRIFDYNDTYTREDITSTITNVITENKLGGWRTGTMYSKASYEASEIFVQVYDINSKLGMEADLKKRDQVEGGMKYEYPLRDKNQDDLEHESSNTFTADAIHDPTDSTSMLRVILPNLTEADGDLILVDADTKATTYSPTTIKYPDYMMLLDIADLADSVVIIHADGKCYLDDDKASGTVLDVDTAAHFDKMTKPVLVTDILEDINYFEIFGAFDPDTGVRFTKIIDNTGSDKKRSWRYINNNFKSQADVDAYATALDSRTTTIKIIKIEVQSIGAHNMGETMDYKYVKAPYNVPQANYYILYERIDYDQNENIIIMSEGMIEESKYAAGYERNVAYTDGQASGIYATDINTIDLNFVAVTGGTWTDYGVQMTNGEGFRAYFYTSSKIDDSRKVIVTFLWRDTAAASPITGTLLIQRHKSDGTVTSTVVVNAAHNVAINAGYLETTYDIPIAHVVADYAYEIRWQSSDADAIVISGVQVEYYVKRSLS